MFNPLMPGGNKKVTHTQTNLQLSGKLDGPEKTAYLNTFHVVTVLPNDSFYKKYFV